MNKRFESLKNSAPKELESLVDAAHKEFKELESALHIANLKIKVLTMKLFGINMERRSIPLPELLDLFKEAGVEIPASVAQSEPDAPASDVAATNASVSNVKTPERAKRKPEENRQELPAELRREVKVLDIPEKDKFCPETGTPLILLRTHVCEVLEINVPEIYVTRYERPEYACKNHPEEGIVAMSLPARIIPKGIPGESLLAHIIVAKYVDHLPLDRFCKMLSRSGVDFSRKTLSDWVISVGRAIEPLRLALQRKILKSRIINADETTYKVLPNHAKGKPINGYLWGYVGDRKTLLFEWNNGRSGVHPLSFLDGAECDWLQTDAYSGYNPALEAFPAILGVGCWAHVRRKFAEAEKVGEKAAKLYLDLIAALYAVEALIREQQILGEEALKLRTEKSRPILDLLIQKAREERPMYLPKSQMGKAVAYMMNHWTAHTAYVTDGDLEIDNNIIERAIRPIAIGRKNWLFSGSETGAQTAALVMSLVGTCALCKVDPAKYMRTLLRLLPNFKGKDYAELLPDALAPQLDELDKAP